MPFKRTHYLVALTGTLFFTFATVAEVYGQGDDKPDAPKQSEVEKFEREMMNQLLHKDIHKEETFFDYKLRDSEAYQNKIREFFTGLRSSEMRIEAIGMLDGRYVYIVNRELATELLGSFIRDADLAVRVRAARAIAYNTCGAKYPNELIALLEGEPAKETLISVARAMGSSGHQPFVRYLEVMLADENSRVRACASTALTELVPEVSFNHNFKLLNDKDPWVRKAAVRNISLTPGDLSVTSLVKMLEDEDPTVREQAVRSLGDMKAISAADALKECLSDINHGVRYRATLSLAEIKHHAQHVALLLNDENTVARRGATIAMGRMGEYRYIDNLRPLLKDEDEQVRKNAEKSIIQLEALAPK